LIEARLVRLARQAPGARPVIPEGMIAQHLAAGQLALIENWVAGQHPCRPEQIAEALFVAGNAAMSALSGLAPG
jgi:hypothetical protein